MQNLVLFRILANPLAYTYWQILQPLFVIYQYIYLQRLKEILVQDNKFSRIRSNTGFCISPSRIVPINIYRVNSIAEFLISGSKIVDIYKAASIFHYLWTSKACYVILALCSDQQGQECVSMIVQQRYLFRKNNTSPLYYNLYCQCSKVIPSNSRVLNYRCLCGCKKEDCNIGGSTELKLMSGQTKLGLLGQQAFAVISKVKYAYQCTIEIPIHQMM